MCTLTVVTRDDGYLIGMNRDERTARGVAAPPARVALDGATAVYPRDVEAGTWIAANDRGLALALLNWNDALPPGAGRLKTRSRGGVILELIGSCSLREVEERMRDLDLAGVLSFRLVGIFPAEHEIREWQWNLRSLECQISSWQPRHWFSSSLGDERAASERGATCSMAWQEERAGSPAWLRSLHASHTGGRGPFSICVHRQGVQTLSYTELRCTPRSVKCRYLSGSPCGRRQAGYSLVALPRARASVGARNAVSA